MLKKFIAQLKIPCDKCGVVLDFADHQDHQAKCGPPKSGVTKVLPKSEANKAVIPDQF